MRVHQTSTFVTDLVRSAAAGGVAPAAFQRDYAWTRDDVEALWTSLLRGWPVGSFLLWEPAQGLLPAVGRTRIGPVEARPEEGCSLLLDGQNRLASLAWSLLPPGAERPHKALLSPVERETWDRSVALVCDPDLDRVLFVPADEADNGLRIPVSALADTRQRMDAFRGLLARGASDAVFKWFDDVENRLRNARAAVTVLERATAAEAVEAFTHIARVGQPVTAAEVADAIGWLDRDVPALPAPR